jgi:MoaA/NifB/PqqE/SkfB family radical SAM enzyme
MLPNKLKDFFTNSFNSRKPFCNAPFGSLYFNQNGQVTACCQNRMFILGNIPEDSIHNIWFGDNVKALRKHILQKEFNLGCFACSPDGSEFSSANKTVYDFIDPNKKYPSELVFQLSNICNLGCKMCNPWNSRNVKPANPNFASDHKYDSHFIDQLDEFIPHLEAAYFLGGESFLIPVFYEIWEKMIQMKKDIKISVLSNGTVYNSKVENILQKGNFEIMLSIDSFDKITYEEIRRNSSYENMLKNLDVFDNYMRSKGGKLILNICPMIDNWQELPSFFNYCCNRNFNIYISDVYYPYHSSLLFLPSAELNKIANYLKENLPLIDWKSNTENRKKYETLINTLEIWEKYAIHYENSPIIKMDNSNELVALLNQNLIAFINKEMSHLQKTETSEILSNLNEILLETEKLVTTTDGFVSILKNILRMPAYELITEGMGFNKNTSVELLLMFG